MAAKNLLVMYHSPCMDGFGAAVAFKDQVNTSDWDSIAYLAVNYPQLANLPFEEGTNSLSGISHVLCLDICPTPATLDYMLVNRGLNVCVLDHHDTAMDNLEHYNKAGLLFTVSEEYSGASLVKALGNAVNFVFGQEIKENQYNDDVGVLTNNDTYLYLDSNRVNESKLYTLLETRDLWLRHDPVTKQQADDAAAYFKEKDIASGPLLSMVEFEALVDIALVEGRKINEAQEVIVMEAIAKGITWEQEDSEGQLVSILVGECPSELGSMFGSIYNDSCMCDSLAVGTYSNEHGIAGLSLRSKGTTGYARIVAEHFGGGGHNHSSGANLKGRGIKSREALVALVKEVLITYHP